MVWPVFGVRALLHLRGGRRINFKGGVMKNGGPAFPSTELIFKYDKAGFPIGEKSPVSGMSLRVWLAGMALPGIISTFRGKVNGSEIAQTALTCADEILKKLDKQT